MTKTATPSIKPAMKTVSPQRLRWHPARLLYLFIVTLLVGILYSEIQALLTDPASALDPSQVRKTLFWQAVLAYPLYFGVACVLAIGAALLGWRLDRRYSAFQEEQRHEEAVAVAEAVVQRAQVEGRLATPGKAIPRELPPRAPGFVGHEQDLADLAATLPQGQAVAIVGMGGIGKSSLAAEAAHALAGEHGAFPGGIAWVRCDERTGLDGLIWIADQLLDAWNAALPAEATARAKTPEDGLELRERALRKRLGASDEDAAQPSAKLALLDNIEPGLPLGRLLDTLEPLEVAVLVTTRTEPTSQHVRLLNLEVLDAEVGARLFAERYTGRGGTRDAARDAATRAIVDALGGLPLAIELAAARAARTRLPLATLAEELRAPDALARLNDPRDPSSGVRYSLRKTLVALTPSQRLRFAALGLPEGPDWPLPVIERMFAGVPTGQADATPAQDDLEALVAYSLVSLVAADGNESTRVRLHPLVRELAREEWTQQPETMQRAALAGLMAGVQVWVNGHRAADPAAIAVLARDEELIVGALRAAAGNQVELPLVVSTVKAFDAYLFSHDFPLREELAKLQLSTAQEIGDRRGELTALHRLMSTLAFAGRSADRRAERYAYGREAVDVARSLDDPKELASALGAASSAAAEAGHPDEARAFDEEGRSIGHSLHSGPGMAGVFTNLAYAAAKVGNLREASGLFAQALESARMGGVHLVTMIILLHNYADVCALIGDYAAAARYEEEAVQLLQSVQDGNEAADLETLGEIALWTGDAARAVRIFQEALQKLESPFFQYDTEMIAHVRGNLAAARGEVARLSGYIEAARQGFEDALTIFKEAEIPYNHLARNYEDFVRERLATLDKQ